MDWSPSFAVGIPLIDEQHQELFRRLQSLWEATDAGDHNEVSRLLDFLDRYVVWHFNTEEREMEALHFPGVAAHREEHQRFIHELARLKVEHRKTGATTFLATELEGAVSDWLKRHILGMDQELGRFLRAVPPQVIARHAPPPLR